MLLIFKLTFFWIVKSSFDTLSLSVWENRKMCVDISTDFNTEYGNK